jgi:hypothetical protein
MRTPNVVDQSAPFGTGRNVALNDIRARLGSQRLSRIAPAAIGRDYEMGFR